MLEQQNPYQFHDTNQFQPTNRLPWPIIVIITLACVFGLFLVACFSIGFMNGFRGARYQRDRTRGDAYYARGDYAHAADEYANMEVMRPDAPNGYRFHGDAEFKMGIYTAAIADYNAAFKHAKGTTAHYRSNIYYARGIVYDARQDHSLAIADYTTALRLDPTNTDALGARAEAYADAKDFTRALQDANAVIAPRPMDEPGYLLRATVWKDAGDHAHAAADYRTAIRLSPEDKNAYDALAQMYDDDGKDAQAVRVSLMELRAYPNDAMCWGSLGWWQCRAGDYKASIASSRHAMALDGSLSYIGLNLGLCYAVSGDWPKAEQTYAAILPRCRPVDLRAGQNDLREARRRYPSVAAIRQSLVMLSNTPSPRAAT